MYIEKTDSTNLLFQRVLSGTDSLPKDEKDALLQERYPIIVAGYQTAGKGQAGNGWDSEPYKNLIFSVLLRNLSIPTNEAFSLTIRVSVAVHQTIATFIKDDQLTIKWPNDIYYGNKKLCGMLLESTFLGSQIASCIAGIGINVNQTVWRAGITNPTSIRQITGKEINLEDLLHSFSMTLEKIMGSPIEGVRVYYLSHLFRRDGFYPFAEREVSIAPSMPIIDKNDSAKAASFLARIHDITPLGEIVLQTQDNQLHTYHFKQIQYIL